MTSSVVQRQVLWFSMINYFGILIGGLATIFIYPEDKAFLGIVRYVYAFSELLFPLLLMGAGQALINFYPMLDAVHQKKLFQYSISTVIKTTILLLMGVFLFGLWVEIPSTSYGLYAVPMAILLAFIQLFKSQSINLGKLPAASFFERILPKVALPTIFVLYLMGVLSKTQGLVGLVLAYGLLCAMLSAYVLRRYSIDWKFDFKTLFTTISKKSYFRYSVYALLGSFGSFLAFRLDALMIPKFLSFDANGTYSIGVILASVIAIPATGAFAIYSPLISKYIKAENYNLLKKTYIENAKHLFFVGAMVYGAMVLGIDSFFKILPTYSKLVEAIPIVLILGANVLFNMATGFSSEIISYSKYYRTNIVLVLILVLLNVALNLYVFLCTDYGIIGVAWASCTTMVCFNVFKIFYIYQKFNMLPFNKLYGRLFLATLCLGVLVWLLPELESPLANCVLKSGSYAIGMVFLGFRYRLMGFLDRWSKR